MSDGLLYGNDPFFVQHLSRYLGETVTVFTTSGGESGSGFTGVLVYVSPDYIRIVTAIGCPPECSLGNACDCGRGYGNYGRYGKGYGNYRDFDSYRKFSCLGSVVDIPLCRIASFVHNTL